MKRRLGFVSNSSSSSFVLVTTQEAHQKALAKLTKFEAAVIGDVTLEQKFLGRSVMVYHELETPGGGWYDDYDLSEFEDLYDGEDIDEEYVPEIVEKYKEILKEIAPDEVLESDADM